VSEREKGVLGIISETWEGRETEQERERNLKFFVNGWMFSGGVLK
jgi:hypothetical protein